MEKLVAEWELNAERNYDDTYIFLKRLKGYGNQNKIDTIAKEKHDYFFSKINCTKCANCCKTQSPYLTKADIKRIADFKNLKPQDIIEQYLKPNEYDPRHLEMNALPCPFLEGNKCSIYDVRPADCEGYPNTHKKQFTTRTIAHAANTHDCPAVFHIIEEMKCIFERNNRKW